VLVVDDDEDVLTTLVELVQRDGHEVMAAPGGRQALELISQGEIPCLALVDLMMPGMSGIELCRELKRDPRTRAMPVIVVRADRTGRCLGGRGGGRERLHQEALRHR
jgi:CheY-like chemotaxis protein